MIFPDSTPACIPRILHHDLDQPALQMNIETPYIDFSTRVKKDWIDYNGHLNVAYYHLIFDQAASDFFRWMGFTPELRKEHEISTFALETHLNFLSEVKLDAEVNVHCRLVDVHPKRFHFFQEMFKTDCGTVAASCESLGTCVDMRSRKSTTIPEPLFERLKLIKAAHADLPRPWQLGHVISVSPKPSS